MKIHKPSYNAESRVYTCMIGNGFRLTVLKEDGVVHPDAKELTKGMMDGLIDEIINSTKGWFSTPLTQIWLSSRIQFDFDEIPAGFEGSVEYEANQLIISKDTFLFRFATTRKEAEKIVISFERDADVADVADVAVAAVATDEIPVSNDNPLGIGPTRRMLEKEVVRKARRKAARALFTAERLTQEYLEKYEDTDWDSGSGDE